MRRRARAPASVGVGLAGTVGIHVAAAVMLLSLIHI